MEWALDPGAHPLVAVYMSKNIFQGPSLRSLPVSIKKGGFRPTVFNETTSTLIEGGGEQRHWCRWIALLT